MALPTAAKSGFTQQDLAQMGPDEITRKRRLAEALLAGGPRQINHPLQGLAELADALVGNIQTARLDRAEREGKANANALFSAGMGMGAFPPAPGGGAAGNASASPSGGSGNYRDAIAGIESGGNYQAMGPETKGDRAYGKYQIMGSNVGNWTQAALGQRMTPQQFLASPEAQDKTFDTIFGGYVQRFGPEGAAQAWFGGPGSVGKTHRSDVLGTDVGSYGKRFMASLGGGGAPVAPSQAQQAPAPAQVASLDPSIGVSPAAPVGNQAAIGQALVEQGIDPNGPQAQAFASLGAGGGAGAVPAPGGTIPQPMPPNAQVTAPAAPLPQQQQMAQALIGGQDPAMTLGAPPIQPGGPDMGTLMNMAGNEFMSPQQQRMIEALTGQRMQQADPEHQLDLEYKRAQLEKLQRGDEDVYAQRTKAAAAHGLDPNSVEGQNFILSGDLPASRGGAAEMSLNTIPGVDEQGNAVLIQVDKAGQAHKTAMPEGVKISKPPMIKDTGTEFQVIDPITREVVQTIPKNVAGAAAQAEQGKMTGAAAFDLPRVEQNAAQTLDVLDRMKTHPGRSGSTGFIEGMLPSRTSAQVDFQSLVDQTQGQSFLQAFQMLKGGGQITEVEGKKATDAISRLGNQRLSDDDYLRAINDLEGVIRVGLERARGQAGSAAPNAVATPSAAGPASPKTEEEYNALPSGSLFIDPDDGKTYRKP